MKKINPFSISNRKEIRGRNTNSTKQKLKMSIFVFLSIFLLCAAVITARAQLVTPGNTPYTVEFWLKSDQLVAHDPSLFDGTGVTLWTSENGKNFLADVATAPVIKYAGMNFNPALDFTGGTKRMVSQDNFQTFANTTRIYRSFYVTKYAGGGTYNAVFAYKSSFDEGWNSATNYLYYAGTATTTGNPGLSKSYGIVSIERGASGTVWHNAKPANFATARPITAGAEKATIGTRGPTLTTYPFNGDIQEIIILSTPPGTPFNVNEVRKINSYLAIKYGLVLENDQPNLYRSDGNVVWDATSHPSYTNYVFGIGRDDATGLSQRQSVCYEENTLTVFMGNKLHEINTDNKSPLKDSVYLILGSNNSNGTVPYNVPDGTSYNNYTLNNESFTNRQTRVYKAQLTGTTSLTVSLLLQKIKARYVVVSPTLTFNPLTNTRIYPIDENGFANNVEIRDGDFIGFVLFDDAPGGTSAQVEFWLKADEIRAGAQFEAGNPVEVWENRTGIIANFEKEGTVEAPVYNPEGFNFHPAVNFSGTAKRLTSVDNFPTYASGTRIYRSFYVTKPDLITAYNPIFAYSNNYDEGWNNAANYMFYYGTAVITFNPGYGSWSSATVQDKLYGITSIERSTGTGKAWHNAKYVSITTARPVGATTDKATIGTSGPAVTTRSYSGDMQEIIILSTPTGTPFVDFEMKKITSYLAIKYGQPLHSDQPDLFSSAGDTVWKASKHAGYLTNVFGIGRDDATGLHQRQSVSCEDNVLTVFMGPELYKFNSENKTTLDELNFLLLGSNNLNGMAAYIVPAGTSFDNTISSEAFTNRQSRIYQAQVTGPSALSVSLLIKQFKARYVLVSANATFTPALSTRIYKVDKDGFAYGVEIGDNDYVGFVVSDEKPGGTIGATLELWLKADEVSNGGQLADGDPVNVWENRTNVMFNFEKHGTTNAPTFNSFGLNYNPSVYFDGKIGTANAVKLVSKDVFNTDATNRRYRSFYVSVPSDTLGGSQNRGAIFAYRDYNDEGWRKSLTLISDYLYYCTGTQVGTYSNFTMGLNYRFGITGMERVTGTGNVLNAWHDAKIPTSAQPNRALGGTSDKAIIGARSVTTSATDNYNNQFRGDIQEIIILSNPIGTNFNATDITKINTYLAVKYGMSLDTVAQPQWINTFGTTVWNTANHRGYNKNIFGIGRDDATGLYQKQSVSSVGTEMVTIFVGDGSDLPNANSENQGVLNDGFFLLFGSNGIENSQFVKTPYIHIAGTQFQNAVITKPLHTRHNFIFQAQITGAPSYSVHLFNEGIRADYVLVSNSPIFDKQFTRIYPFGKNRIAEDVFINDNDYISFAYEERSPGGTAAGLMMWLKADAPTTIDVVNGDVMEWRDSSENPNDIRYYYKKPVVVNKAPGFLPVDPNMNYHPAVNFRDNKAINRFEYLSTDQAPFSKKSPNEYTLISVVSIRQFGYATGSENISYIYSFGNDNVGTSNTLTTPTPDAGATAWRAPAFGFQKLTNGRCAGRSYFYSASINGTKNLYNANATTIAMQAVKVGTSGTNSFLRFEADCDIETMPGTTVYARRNDMNMNGKGIIGTGSRWARQMIGTVSEIIYYEKLLTQTESDKLYSYLALKYGVTLFRNKDLANKKLPSYNPTCFDYFLADGTVVWPGISNPLYKKFHNNVSAIVRDDAADLNNMQSHSTDDGSAVLMGIGNRIGVNPDLTGLNTDQEWIIWGNNNKPFSDTTYIPNKNETGCAEFTRYLTKRIWMVDVHTQEDYTVLIGAFRKGFSMEDDFPYDGPGYEVWLILADSVEKIEQKRWDLTIPGVYLDGMHQFVYTFEAGKKYYFTFGANKLDNYCDACDVGTRLKDIKFTSATWPPKTKTKKFILNDAGFAANMKIEFIPPGNARFYGSYPRPGTGGALNITRERNAQQIMRTTIDLDTAAMSIFHVRKIDYYSGCYTNVKIYGKCGGDVVVPYLDYMTNAKNSIYTINKSAGLAYADKKRHIGRTNKNGYMYVEFDDPVSQIVIDHNLKGKATVLKYFDIGPLSFTCPALPPPINIDGLSFTQQAMPRELLLCDEVCYSYRIKNNNCFSKAVDFKVILPEGMKFLYNSLSIDDVHLDGAEVNPYAATDSLTIKRLVLPGLTTTIFRVYAYFDDNAQPGDYINRAQIDYIRVVDSKEEDYTLESCDRLTSGCEPTTVKGLPTGERLKPLKILGYDIDKPCFDAGDTVTFTMQFINPNTNKNINNAVFDVSYTEGFKYLNNSLVVPSIGMGTPDFFMEEPDAVEYGFMLYGTSEDVGFSIPPNVTYTISFKLVAPDPLEPDFDYTGSPMLDGNGYQLYTPLNILAEFATVSEADCEESIFREAFVEAEIFPRPVVSIDGNNIICIGEIAQLSHKTGGTWTSNNPTVASVDNTGKITGLKGGKATFSFLVDGSQCVAISDTLTVYTPQIFWQDTIYVGVPVTFTSSERGEWVDNYSPFANIMPTGLVTGLEPGRLVFVFKDSDSHCSAFTDSVTVLMPYRVYYNGNGNTGGTAPDDPTLYPRRSTATVIAPDVSFTKTCYSFIGWSFKPNAASPDFNYNGSAFTGNTSFPITGDTILYAVWRSDSVTLSVSINTTYCVGAPPDPLSKTINGVSGTWSPPTINTSAITPPGTPDEYTFTPNLGQCAKPLKIFITVVQGPVVVPKRNCNE